MGSFSPSLEWDSEQHTGTGYRDTASVAAGEQRVTTGPTSSPPLSDSSWNHRDFRPDMMKGAVPNDKALPDFSMSHARQSCRRKTC